MLGVLVAHAEYVCFTLSPVLCWRLCRRPDFPSFKNAHWKHIHTHSITNTNAHGYRATDFGAPVGQCCKMLFKELRPPTCYYRLGVILSLWTCLIFPVLLWPECSHLISIFDTMCGSQRFVLFGQINCCASLRTPDKTERYKWNLVAEVSHYPSSPRSCLHSQKEKNLYLLNSQTQPGNQIVIHRISPCVFSRTLLTQMEKYYDEISARKLARCLCLCT